jgi:hypothetical protein
MADERTCGRGLADHSSLTAKLAELTAAVADNLEVHMKSLDLADARAKKEHDAYAALTDEHRRIAEQLVATSKEMAGYRDLPMGGHHPEAALSPEVLGSFERLVKVEHELVTLLEKRAQRDQRLLVEMVVSASGGAS